MTLQCEKPQNAVGNWQRYSVTPLRFYETASDAVMITPTLAASGNLGGVLVQRYGESNPGLVTENHPS